MSSCCYRTVIVGHRPEPVLAALSESEAWTAVGICSFVSLLTAVDQRDPVYMLMPVILIIIFAAATAAADD